VRTPRNTLSTVLTAACACALFLVFGGPGGCWIMARDTRRRVRAFAEDLDALDRRVARYNGEKGHAVAQANKSAEAAELDRIVAAQRNGKRKPAPSDGLDGVDLPEWAKATMAGWMAPTGRE
jgi:hypothetical protein